MKKILSVLFFSASLSLFGSDQAFPYFANFEDNLKSKSFKTVTVTTASEFNDAIEQAANNTHRGTIIRIKGTIIGNFEIPAMVNPIKLVGVGSQPTLNADGSGTPLTIDLGAVVKIKNLTISGAGNGGSVGIFNSGKLRISDSIIKSNSGYAGIDNRGFLKARETEIVNNFSDGIYTEFGGVLRLEKCKINFNEGYGIYSDTSKVLLDKSEIEGNSNAGIYNYYASRLSVNNSKI